MNEGAEEGEPELSEKQVGRLIHTGNFAEVKDAIFKAFSMGNNGTEEPPARDDEEDDDEEIGSSPIRKKLILTTCWEGCKWLKKSRSKRQST